MQWSSLLFYATLVASTAGSGYATALSPSGSTQPQADDAGRRDIQGNWQGVLNTAVGKLRLILKVTRTADGTLKATMDSPDQHANDLPVATFSFKESYVHFEMPTISASFDGALSRDGSELAGQFKQGGGNPLVLVREGAAATTPQLGFVRGRIKLDPCNALNITRDAGCGKYEVFEDRAARSGRKIALNILVLPALAAKPAADPVFVLAGGPGQSAVSLPKLGGDYLIKLRRDRDLVFVDQRGTGESNPLPCNFVENKEAMRGYFVETLTVENLRECRAQLEKTANLALYTSTIAMDDLDEVRSALGYDKINLLGASYGTYAAFVYMRQFPEHMRSAMMEGVSSVDAKIYLPFAKAVDHALERWFADCAADKDCNAAFPNLRADFQELTAKLEKQPSSFEAVNLLNGKREQITLSRAMFGEHLRTMLYIPIYARWLPVLIHEANKNNFGPFASISHTIYRSLGDQIARGMQLSVTCAEDIPFITEDEIKRSTAGTFYGDYRVRMVMRACEQWPRGKVAANFSQPVKSNAPVLMITGDLDPVAPPWLATGAARLMPNSRQITITNTGHYFRFDCVDDLFAEFVSRASAKSLDDSCVKEIERPPFVVKLPPSLAK
jgi:pimeloyl-ACP methyl ester carboxylesterase